MFTWRQVFRVIQTLAVPVLLSLAVNYFFPKSQEEIVPPSQFLPVLRDIGFVPRTFPVTYRFDESSDFEAYERVHNVTTFETPDTTAVMLNWSRFPNVLLITSLLCGPWLDDTIAEVVIWNNSPRKYQYEDFKYTGCKRSKLKIHNAPGNMYFQGRFIACAGASTPYCFIQDDDFLIRPEIIKALRTRIAESKNPHAIHILPPEEHLSTSLREIHVPKPDPSYLSDMHTSFAWLGHGTMMHRSKADEFLALMLRLRVSQDEMKMADNYFTILSNRVPEVWFDQDFALGGGHAFTVGQEGEDRNRKHILRATHYLDAVAHCGSASCDPESDHAKQSRVKVPYASLAEHWPPSSWTRAACRGAACVLETNIQLLPDTSKHSGDGLGDIFSVEAHNLAELGESGKQHYEAHPPSNAVDTRPDTAFRGYSSGTKGDTIVVDILADVSNVHEWQTIEMVWLVDAETEKILSSSTFESSTDGETWREASQRPLCDDTKMSSPANGNSEAGGAVIPLRECSVQMVVASNALHLRATGRYFRARLEEDRSERWIVYEIWLRGL